MTFKTETLVKLTRKGRRPIGTIRWGRLVYGTTIVAFWGCQWECSMDRSNWKKRMRGELIRTRLCVKQSSGIQEGYEWDEKHCFLSIVLYGEGKWLCARIIHNNITSWCVLWVKHYTERTYIYELGKYVRV